MFVPYAIDASFDRRPVVNWLAILGIVLVFALQLATSEKQVTGKSKKGIETPLDEVLRVRTVENEAAAKHVEKKEAVTGPMALFVLNGWGFGLFTYFWLQGGIIRFVGNLIFLWPFGNAVCAKLGNKLYPLVFLGFGLLAGVIHLLLADKMVVGAGGVICGIVGIYIVLFPEDTMSCFFLLPRPMAASISGGWVVVLWFIFDLLEAGLSSRSTAYCAHILCVGAGAGLAILMLKKNWLVMEKDEKSLLQMLARKETEEEKEKKEGEKKGEEEQKKDLETAEEQPQTPEKAKAEPSPAGGSRLAQAIAERTSAEGASRPAQVAPGDALQQKTVPEVQKPEDDFIRFKCECGHRIKVHKRDAGKAGRCPKCLRWVEAPRS